MNELLKKLFEVGDYRYVLNLIKNYNLDKYNEDLIKCYALLFLDDLKGSQIIADKYQNDLNFLFTKAYISFYQMDEKISIEIAENIINNEDVLDYIKLESYIIMMNSLVRIGEFSEIEKFYKEALEYALYRSLFVYRSIIDFVYYMNIDRIYEDERFKKVLIRTEFELKNYNNLNYYAQNLLYNAVAFATQYQLEEAKKRLNLAYEVLTRIGSTSLLSRYFLTKYFIGIYADQFEFDDLKRALEYAEISQNYINKELALNYITSYYISFDNYNKAYEALKEYETFISNINREFPRFLSLKASFLSKTGEYRKALELLDKAYTLAKGKFHKVSIKLEKCLVFKKMGDFESAYHLFLELLEEKEILHQAMEKFVLKELKPIFKLYLERNKQPNENFMKLIIKSNLDDEFKIPNIQNYMDETDILKRIDRIKDKIVLGNLKKKLKYHIYLFGKLKVVILDKVLHQEDFERPINARVFKYFLLNRNRFLPKEKIFDELWPNDEPKKASQKLHTIISNVRKILIDDEIIKSSGGSYGLFTDDRFYIDVEDFENSIKSAIAIAYRDEENAISKIIYAFDIYSGDLLEGDLYEEWIYVERERLKQLLSQGILLLSELLSKRNLEHLAIAYLESTLFRNVDNKVFNKLINLLKSKSLDYRIEFWNSYIKRALG